MTTEFETKRSPKSLTSTLTALLCALIVTGMPATIEAQPIDALGPKVPRVPTKFFNGDTYSFHHQLGALIDGVVKCFSNHRAGTNDNTVLFDGVTELLDPYTNGDQPFIFEFETFGTVVGKGITEPNRTFTFFSNIGNDFFPEGFEDPETGTPLELACIEIGLDDTLDADEPVEVVSAQLEFSNDNNEFEIFDLISSVSNPFDGRLAFSAPGLVGRNMNGMILDLTMKPAETVFADGFESGNTAAWTEQQ